MNHVFKVIRALILVSFAASALAQEVVIPDAGLNAAVRAALQKPAGPLTQQDMLALNNLSAGNKQISDLTGLGTARNLSILDLDLDSLANFNIGSALTNLTILDLFENHLTNFDLSNCSTRLTIIDGSFNAIAHCFIPDGLTNLDTLFLQGNALTNFDLPAGLNMLTQLGLDQNNLASFTVRPEMTNLTTLTLFINQLTNLTLPPNLIRLTAINADINQLTHLDLPEGLINLRFIIARNNQLTNLTLRADMTNLSFIDLESNQLSDFTVPDALAQMNFLRLSGNKLTSITLSPGMTNLESLFLQNNQLTNVVFSPGMKQLVQIDLSSNNLASLVLPPDMTNLTTVVLDGNPLLSLVLSEPMAVKLSSLVTALQNQGVNVLTYPLAVQLIQPRQPIGAFQFTLAGPPSVYTVLRSTDLVAWSALATVTNRLGKVVFTDATANLAPQKFYRTVIQPPNMVFIAPNTFTLGSPTNEVGRQSDESPQTTVMLTHGFWMAQFLVTQRDYVDVMGTNPSGFPGDLNRPIESVSWFDATNYCDKLTQQDFAAGRIPPGSHYRLPTEAEWECAARAGTSTSFYFGDDATSLTNNAWYSANSGFTTRPVGLKQPNAWGLYDMEGNVWEWCQDWYGPYPGGSVIDPQGPASNSIGFKVIRGGAWESGEAQCRSARRDIKGASPFITDFILGFRVVLTLEP
jgi:formylglycine-generating enzyme required for sulfatase activity